MPCPPPEGLLKLLEAYAPPIREIALATRQAVLKQLAPCHENILQVYTIAMGYGPNSHFRDQIMHITVHAKHVNLGFNFGVLLDDTEDILLGDGSQIRHIRLQSLDDVAKPVVAAYIGAAIELAHLEDAEDRVKKGVVSVIKITPKKKKR